MPYGICVVAHKPHSSWVILRMPYTKQVASWAQHVTNIDVCKMFCSRELKRKCWIGKRNSRTGRMNDRISDCSVERIFWVEWIFHPKQVVFYILGGVRKSWLFTKYFPASICFRCEAAQPDGFVLKILTEPGLPFIYSPCRYSVFSVHKFCLFYWVK